MAYFEEILTPLYSTTWGRSLSLILLVCFSLLVIFSLVQIPLSWHHDLSIAREKTTQISATLSEEKTADLTSQVPHMHLFGTPATPDTVLPITSLQLKLIGVVHSTPDHLSRVIISEAGQPGKVYRVGESFSGVKVNAITPDGVILDNGGQLEKLPLQRHELEFRGRPQSNG